jgi:hypothetical protein
MSPNDEVFVCSCRDELKSKDDVDKHEAQEYWSQRHGKQCDFPGCKDTIRQTSNAKRHWRTHLPERLGRYFCIRCGIGYAKPEALKKHEDAVDCRKNRRMCRRTSEHDAAPPASRQMATSLPDPQADESLPPHPEETFNDTSPPSASSTAPHAVEWPSLPMFAPSRGQILCGSFTMDTSQRVQLSNDQQRKRSRSVFEDDVALAIPPITPRNGMSSSDGLATDSETSSEVLPSDDTSPPSTNSTPSVTELASYFKQQQERDAAEHVASHPFQLPPPTRMMDNFIPTAGLQQYPAVGLDWSSLPLGPPQGEETYSEISDDEPEIYLPPDGRRYNISSSRSTRERSMGLPTTAPLDKRSFRHIQRPSDTRANTGTYTCMCHGCTQRFESQPALLGHKRDFHRSQEHNHNDSGAESGTASVSPRPHTRPVLRTLRSEHTHVPHVQPPKHRFVIGRSQESQLEDFRKRYAGRELPSFYVLVAGCWGSVGSLLSDLTEIVRFYPRPGPSSTSLWEAIAKATAPELPREMVGRHLSYFSVDGGQWTVDLEWTEEGITGHWQECGTALKWPEGKAKSITVCTDC